MSPQKQQLIEDKQQQTQPHVVIVGTGFGGLEAARTLHHASVQVTVIDRWNHHLFQPMLYQVATAGLSLAGAWLGAEVDLLVLPVLLGILDRIT